MSMKNTYRFSNILVKGKNLSFNVENTESYNEALKKATNYIVKKFKIPESEWMDQYSNLKKNIEDGHFNVSVEKNAEQGELDLQHSTFNELYYGIINES